MDGRRQRILIGKRRKTNLWWSSSTMRMNLLLITVVASSAAEGRKDRTRPLPVYDSLPPILLPSFINQRPRAQSFNPSIQVGKRALLLLLPFHFLCLPFSFLFSPKSTPPSSSSSHITLIRPSKDRWGLRMLVEGHKKGKPKKECGRMVE